MEDALPVENPKEVLERYYEGQQIPSPQGGYLMRLAIRPGEKGTAVAIFECSASSLRYKVTIPKATRTERRKVREVLKEGDDPNCPRHVDTRLVRAGKDLVCPLCGVAYARA